MTNQELADYLFPDVKDISYYETKYPKRALNKDAMVTRFGPSPTGFVHMGSLYLAFMDANFARQTNGIFYLRIEDTDDKRAVSNGVDGIINDLKAYDVIPNEGYDFKDNGYGPYIQSERGPIYQAYAKYMVAHDLAYPCFCQATELDHIREIQTAAKERIGYYGPFAKCRHLTNKEIMKHLDKKEPFVIRLKSQGDFTKIHLFNDVIKGEVQYCENDMDIVLLKSDMIPTYHFAHVVDDHLMHTTHVLRGEEWLDSLPIHLEITKMLGFEAPFYGHIATVNKKEGNIVRKLSKRKDPEASIKFYLEKGIPIMAVKLYLATIGNSNFEEWFLANPNKPYTDFTFTFDKMPKSGTLFDVDKLLSIAKEYLSTLSANEIYDETLNYTKTYDLPFYQLLIANKDYVLKLLSIERNIERPRKDIGCYSDVKKEFWYMFDELFTPDSYLEIETKYDADDLIDYLKLYDETLSQEDWFSQLKVFVFQHGYATNRKDYKDNPTHYKGDTAFFCEALRVMLTTSKVSPNLYDLLKLYGQERLIKRAKTFKATIK